MRSKNNALPTFPKPRYAPKTEPPGVLRIGSRQKENLLKGVRDEEQRDQVQSGIQVSGGA